jgi:hypothetical protein
MPYKSPGDRQKNRESMQRLQASYPKLIGRKQKPYKDSIKQLLVQSALKTLSLIELGRTTCQSNFFDVATFSMSLAGQNG